MPRIDDFKAIMRGGGARSNQFRVTLTLPAWAIADSPNASRDANFLVKSAMLPGSIVEDIPVFYRGRQTHFAGERYYQPWHVQAYIDTSFGIRNGLEAWQRGFQNYDSTEGRTIPSEYQTDILVDQHDRAENVIKRYKLVNAYPTNMSPVPLDYDQQNTIEIFDIEFTFDYFTSDTGARPTNDTGGISLDTPLGRIPII